MFKILFPHGVLKPIPYGDHWISILVALPGKHRTRRIIRAKRTSKVVDRFLGIRRMWREGGPRRSIFEGRPARVFRDVFRAGWSAGHWSRCVQVRIPACAGMIVTREHVRASECVSNIRALIQRASTLSFFINIVVGMSLSAISDIF